MHRSTGSVLLEMVKKTIQGFILNGTGQLFWPNYAANFQSIIHLSALMSQLEPWWTNGIWVDWEPMPELLPRQVARSVSYCVSRNLAPELVPSDGPYGSGVLSQAALVQQFRLWGLDSCASVLVLWNFDLSRSRSGGTIRGFVCLSAAAWVLGSVIRTRAMRESKSDGRSRGRSRSCCTVRCCSTLFLLPTFGIGWHSHRRTMAVHTAPSLSLGQLSQDRMSSNVLPASDAVICTRVSLNPTQLLATPWVRWEIIMATLERLKVKTAWSGWNNLLGRLCIGPVSPEYCSGGASVIPTLSLREATSGDEHRGAGVRCCAIELARIFNWKLSWFNWAAKASEIPSWRVIPTAWLRSAPAIWFASAESILARF